MKNTVISFIIFLFSMTSLWTAPQAVVFDFAGVLASRNQTEMVKLLTETFQFSPQEFQQRYQEMVRTVNVKTARSEVDFWVDFAKKNNKILPKDWVATHDATLKASVIIDQEMYALIDELKRNKVRVGLLSNIDFRLADLLRNAGYYTPFDPCVLTCDIGVEKPDLKAYTILIEKMALPADKIIFVDDRIENVEAAKKVGIDAIFFESPTQIRKELMQRKLLQRQGATLNPKIHPTASIFVVL